MPEFVKAHPKKNKAFRLRWAQSQEQRCQACYVTINGMWLSPEHARAEFHVHHLIGGSNGRSDEACNFLLLCHRCHIGGTHNYDKKWNLTREHLLWVKSQTPEWNPERLWALAHRRYEPVELPAVYLKERELNQGG